MSTLAPYMWGHGRAAARMGRGVVHDPRTI
jgi:hypothetical protein